MDAKRFDDLARLVASQSDRRTAVKRLAGAAALGVGSLLGIGKTAPEVAAEITRPPATSLGVRTRR
ncbi:MAG: hypothetical protein M3Y37_11620, partial [Chloroflexota bacterium]|nr:hypothetical protein [Chloroflexota bacterium]